ncbi:uncharacterized protein LOC142528995 isoform X1 [Primulina tabacum]|uniref:uncharacterized protein LOC142528995 isoform X1 n=1 Tax=Primulina tabacum TaxID=48773 RepID=UPI003F5A8FB2
MHSQDKFNSQVGRGTYLAPYAFQQNPGGAAAAPTPLPPLTFHQRPLGSQAQTIRQAHPTFPRAPGSLPFLGTPPGAPHQGPIAHVLSNAVNSGQSYLTHNPPPPLQGSTEISHSYPAPEPQRFPWSHSVPQISPMVPIPAPRSYLLPNLQGFAGPPLQPPSHHAPRPPLLSYLSTSSSSITNPLVTSTRPGSQHSYLHSIGPLPPPPLPQPPPPPPLPPSSPPGVPPLPPSSPPNLSKNDGIHDLKQDSPHENDSESKDHLSPLKPAKNINANNVNVIFNSTEIVPVPEATDATFAHSPADSDMDMEDDITQPDVEKSFLSRNLDEERLSLPQDYVHNEHVKVSQHPGGRRPSEVALVGSLLYSGSSVLGPKIPSSSEGLVTGDAISEFNDSANGVNDMDVNAQLLSSSQHANISQLNLPVASADTIGGKLSNQLIGTATPFKLLQGYVTDDSSGNDVKSPCGDISHSQFDTEKRDDFVSELESNKHLPSKSTVLSFAPGKTEEFSDRNLGDQGSIRVGTDLEDADSQKPNMRGNDAKLNVDEFGRLVREGVGDSDTSNSPRYTRRHERRGRKQSRSQSRSRSPPDGRSLFRRKERRHQYRRLSPKRRRSRSRSPVLRRGSEFDGDKLRRGKGHFAECFDFLRGKCYRGVTCRFAHDESDKSERLRNNRGQQQYQDTPPALGNHNSHSERIPEKKSVLGNEVANDKELTLLEQTHGVKEVKNKKELPVDSFAHFPDKLNYVQSASPLVADVEARNLSSYSSPDMALGNKNSRIQESPAQILCENPQLVDQRSKQIGGSLTCESSPVQASAALSIYLPSDKLEPAEDPIGNLWVGGSPKTKPYSIDDVPPLSRNLNDSSPSITTSPLQLPFTLPSVSHVTSSHFGRGIPQNHNLVSSTAPFLLKNEQNSPYLAPVSYRHPHIPEPPNTSSSSFIPPPPPRHTHLTLKITSGDRSILLDQHMQQSLLPPGNGSSSYGSTRTDPSELRTQSQTCQYQAYPSSRDPDQIPHKADHKRSSTLYASNLTSKQVERHISGEDSAHSVPHMTFLHSVSGSGPKSFTMYSPPRGTNPFLVGSLPSSSNPSGSLPYSQQNYYGMNSTSRIAPDFLERNHHDFVGPRISNNFNPCASAFDHPPSTRFGTNALIQENGRSFNNKHDPPLGLSSDHVYGCKFGSVNLPSMDSSSTSAQLAEGFLSRSVGKKYDPLLDSIEPASNSFGISDQQKNGTTGGSYDIHRFKQEEDAVVSAYYSHEIEEFGEMADAEVVAVVNGSPGNPHVTAEVNAGKNKNTLVKESGKYKKGKDSRSTKLFKVSIASFVKEVLKPSWRQGNMSKEAFKTVVKKTVDKVSSAMKSHKIPKSQEKIIHYIDSSRGKLTKLIMGYVDKYVKT